MTAVAIVVALVVAAVLAVAMRRADRRRSKPIDLDEYRRLVAARRVTSPKRGAS